MDRRNRMKINRRNFLVGGLAFLPIASYGLFDYGSILSQEGLAIKPTSLLLSSVADKLGQNYLAALDEHGLLYYQLPIPERAHDSLYNRISNEAIYFGRSPSQSIYIVNIENKELAAVVNSASNRHFYGHGVIDKTCRYLYVVEKNTLTNKGCIGVYDTRDGYKKIDEFDSYGVGPHQIALLSDNKTVVVANGGLLKDKDKNIINESSFQSSLAYIDTSNGVLIEAYPSEYKGNSLRHLTVDKDDGVFVGAQSYDDAVAPLVFSHQGEDQLVPFLAEEYIWQAHNRYTASLVVLNDQLIVSSPRGNVLTRWDITTGQFLSKHHYIDVAGLSLQTDPGASRLFVSTGQGRVIDFGGNKSQRANYYLKDIAWDNHLSLAALSS